MDILLHFILQKNIPLFGKYIYRIHWKFDRGILQLISWPQKKKQSKIIDLSRLENIITHLKIYIESKFYWNFISLHHARSRFCMLKNPINLTNFQNSNYNCVNITPVLAIIYIHVYTFGCTHWNTYSLFEKYNWQPYLGYLNSHSWCYWPSSEINIQGP